MVHEMVKSSNLGVKKGSKSWVHYFYLHYLVWITNPVSHRTHLKNEGSRTYLIGQLWDKMRELYNMMKKVT